MSSEPEAREPKEGEQEVSGWNKGALGWLGKGRAEALRMPKWGCCPWRNTDHLCQLTRRSHDGSVAHGYLLREGGHGIGSWLSLEIAAVATCLQFCPHCM